ncbi:transmembrane protein [Mycobacterium pseudoshottsii JCM 15466]|uniref:Rv1733c family protein n=1 Tax=Mycobacterium pseudoshottsii TaxID=265949 RepID=UPI00076E99A4|nr:MULTISPECIES: hypothetical protein [Mycobacterium ulcerans group]RFZ69652.1 putative membrane protein [Mycobacterium marinum]BBA88989.1 membrane protein [Mycobacterium pseudoshottsii JCM 15466]GAQ32905.1 transmembrane protein [Mycobacterium pseudoshottsii JCM 15466]
METFKLDPRDWWIARIAGRNPLLRRADRVEALVVLIVLAASLVAIPVAAVLGAVVFNARADQYAEQAQVRHPVTAEVTGTTRNPNTEAVVVQVRWPGAAAQHSGSLQRTSPVKAGQRIQVWVDRDDNLVRPPTPTWHAAVDAVGVTMVILLSMCVVLAALVAAVRTQLDRVRDAQWDRELGCLQDDDGRTNRY